MPDEIDELAKLMANRIGSPWGEGATYSHERAETSEKPKENGCLNSHLDDEDFELFVSDLKQAILALKKKWETEARVNELKLVIPPEQYEDYAKLMGDEMCHICGFNACKFRRLLQERINQLTHPVDVISNEKPLTGNKLTNGDK